MVTNDPPDIRTLLEEEERRTAEAGGGHLRAITWWGPIAATAAILVLTAVLAGPGVAGQLVAAAALIFFVFGKFAVLFGVGGDSPFSPWDLAAIVSYMDVTIATLLVLNLPRIYRLPRVGPFVEELAEHGLYMLQRRRWLGRVTFLGVIAFVMFPLTGTGAIGGSIFGRLLGLPAVRTLVAIAIGAVAGSFGMALFADSIKSWLTEDVQQSPWFQGLGLAVVLLMVTAVWVRGRRVAREIRARKAERGSAGGPSG